MSNTSASGISDSPSQSAISSTTTTSTTTSSTTTTTASLPPSDPVSSSLPPSDSASLPLSSSISPSSSLPPSTSSPPPTSTSTTSASTSQVLSFSTNSNGGVVTFTRTQTQTQSGATPTASGEVRAATKSFLQNKGAVAAVFTIVGLVAAGILFALVTGAIRRRKAKRFDREIAEEAKRAPAPVFVDDDDYNDGGYSSAYGSGGGYHDGAYGAAAGAHDNYTVAADPYAAGHGPSSDGYPASDAVHSGGGTPSNYMYPSGYSDLGFSDVSSHGTFAQPPMDAYGHGTGYGAGVGAAGAYEMMGYVPHTGQDWHNQGGQGAQGGYVYPGEDPHNPAQGGYPPTATTAHSSGSDVLGRSKSGARSLVDSYNTPPSEGASGKGVNVQQPQYADGYVSHYQNQGHLVEDGAYGGMESHHGHIVGEDDEESEGEGDGRRVLKVANE